MNWNRFLTSSDVMILLYLLRHGEVRYSELLKAIGKTRGVVAASLHDLKRRRLVERTVVEQTSPIQTKYKLTDKGREVARVLSQLLQLISAR